MLTMPVSQISQFFMSRNTIYSLRRLRKTVIFEIAFVYIHATMRLYGHVAMKWDTPPRGKIHHAPTRSNLSQRKQCSDTDPDFFYVAVPSRLLLGISFASKAQRPRRVATPKFERLI